MKKQKDHPFFCYKKNCRKTAWDTPEYLSQQDWQFIPIIINILQDTTPTALYDAIWSNTEQAKRFFDHIIGWPEGFIYCRERKYCEVSAFPSLKLHTLPNLINSLKIPNLIKSLNKE